jgi:hypothetical protein
MADQEKKSLWITWAHDALSRYELPDKVDDADEFVEDMVDVVTKYADAMLEEFDERFSGGARRRRKKDKDDDDDDDDDPDLDD